MVAPVDPVFIGQAFDVQMLSTSNPINDPGDPGNVFDAVGHR
jgi:hypothetical protein